MNATAAVVPSPARSPRTRAAWIVGVLSCALSGATLASGADEKTAYRFDFGSGPVAPGYIKVLPTTVYTAGLGHGFDGGSKVTAVDRGGDEPLRGDFCTGEEPFFFSVDLPEGNYN